MTYISDRNYLNDKRTKGPAKPPILYLYDEVTDEEEEIELPTHWEVCDVCYGEGKHVNPSIDCGGISDQTEDDPDFRNDYLSGVYDVVCYTCAGKRVVKAVDWDAMPEAHKKAYEEQLQYEYESRQENLAELRMGA